MFTLSALEPTAGFDLHSIGIFLHILLFVYWLGSDVGVYYASRFVINPSVPLAGRQVAMKIVANVDLAPRITMILILPSGVTLMAASELGRDTFYGWPLAAVWVGALAWLFIMLKAFFRSAHGANVFGTLDRLIRWTGVVGLVGVGLYAIIAAEPFGVTSNPKWLGLKVIVYGLCIFCGLMIRGAIAPLGPAMKGLADGTELDANNKLVASSMARSLPWVFSIWAFVVIAAFLGIVKPGAVF